MPTYTKKEALEMMLSLDYEGLLLLKDLIEEEKHYYSNMAMEQLNGLMGFCLELANDEK